MDRNQELQDLTEELLVEALTVELLRFAAAQDAPALTRFSGDTWRSLLSRCGNRLDQLSSTLRIWGQALTADATPPG